LAKTIEELISKHFRRSVSERFTANQEPGEPIDAAQAHDICGTLSPRQRTHLDADTIEALDALIVEGAELLSPEKYVVDPTKLKSHEWFKKRRSPELEKTYTTLLIIERVLRNPVVFGVMSVGRNSQFEGWVKYVAQAIGKRALHPDAAQVLAMLESRMHRRRPNDPIRFDYSQFETLVKVIEEVRDKVQPEENDIEMLTIIRDQLESDGYGSRSRQTKEAIDQILAGGEQVETPLLWEGEAWAKQLNEAIRALPKDRVSGATELLKYAGTVSEYSKPGKAWFAGAQKIADAMGKENASAIVESWLRIFVNDERPELAQFEERYGNRPADRRAVNRPRLRENTTYMLGLAYLARCAASPQVLLLLTDIVEHLARSKHGVREQSQSIAIGALRSLEASSDPSAVACLSRLALRLRYPKLRKAAEKSYTEYLSRNKISRDDADETSVPDFGLAQGVAKISIADTEAIIAMARGDRPTLAWSRADKPPSHIVPKVLKALHPEQVKAIVQTVDDIEKTVAAQRTRIDLMFRREVNWSYATWKSRYLDHGLLFGIVRRLIWSLDGAGAICIDNAWQDVEGRPIKVRDGTKISLWHPALRPADEVLAWRKKLEALAITQPMKQAHREVYLLTDAERRTNTYSNRYAAHIVKNHATLAISQVRKWKMGMYGGASSPSLELPHFGLRAEWWLEAAGPERDRIGAPLYLSSDQVRFYEQSETEPMELSRVPALAFTEVMRDIDLFVGIASVGNDPNWRDGEHTGRYRDYWASYSFGELSATAKTRREVLATLLPRLTRIRDRASLSDKFLIIRGDLRSYKIHLGSGNILMEPNDQYLCIVPDRSARGIDSDVFLPFEGDSTLSIVLSKAFLLADDAKIDDPTITRQIQSPNHPINLA
jgi:hypothetical protein